MVFGFWISWLERPLVPGGFAPPRFALLLWGIICVPVERHQCLSHCSWLSFEALSFVVSIWNKNRLWAIASPSYSLTWFWRITNDHFIKWYQVAFSCITTQRFCFTISWGAQNLGERTEGCSEGFEEVKVETWTKRPMVKAQDPGYILALGMFPQKK